jgi:hypothetical protein
VSDNFTQPATFADVPVGGRFVEVMTTCDEVAVRIEPTTHRGKTVNARRAGGKLIKMEDWEPVLVEVNRPDLGGN